MSDITIFIHDRDGIAHELLAPTDMNMNLRELILGADLATEDTFGTCGGDLMCASCQCYIETDHELKELSDDEDYMLDDAQDRQDNSRLSCQLFLNEEMDGLRVSIGPEQE